MICDFCEAPATMIQRDLATTKCPMLTTRVCTPHAIEWSDVADYTEEIV